MLLNQRSYKNEKASLYIVPTPIGNLEDITIRSLNVLKEVEDLFCEDTRVTRNLLNHFEIKCNLHTYHTHNEKDGVKKVLSILETGKDTALVSDAGMPLISDPGILLIDKIKEAGFNVVVLPGASAFVVGAVSSGYVQKELMFYGFLDKAQSKRKAQIAELLNTKIPAIIYETPYKLISTLNEIKTQSPNQELFIAKEISKIFEQYLKGSVDELIEYFSVNQPKGEFLIVLPPQQETEEEIDAWEEYNKLLDAGESKKEAIKMIAKKLKVNKNEIYQLIIKEENEQ